MYHFLGKGHVIAESMRKTIDLQTAFIENNIMLGNPRIIEAMVDDPDIENKGVSSRKQIYSRE